MFTTANLVTGLGLLLITILLGRMLHNGLYRVYPSVTVYLFYALCRTLALQYFEANQHPFYAHLYWYSNAVAVVLWLTVAWNVHHRIFSADGSVRALAAVGVSVALGLLAVSFYFANDPHTSWVVEIERKIGLSSAVWFLLILVLAKLCQLPVGRNELGIAAAGGVYQAIAALNFSALDAFAQFYPVLRIVRPWSFIALLLWWLWAVWKPNHTRGARVQQGSAEASQWWQAAWNSAEVTVKRVFHQ